MSNTITKIYQIHKYYKDDNDFEHDEIVETYLSEEKANAERVRLAKKEYSNQMAIVFCLACPICRYGRRAAKEAEKYCNEYKSDGYVFPDEVDNYDGKMCLNMRQERELYEYRVEEVDVTE